MSTFYMKILRFFPRSLLFFLSIFLFAVACSPQAAPTPFRPPTAIPPTQPLPTTTSIPAALPATFTPIPTLPSIASTAEEACTNALTFINDVTIPDGTTFAPGASMDKQWLVQNDGTCDWDSTYKLKWVGGFTLSVAEEQPLFPARAGSQATLRIIFLAPTELGTYQSTWQATDPDGSLFGDTVFMEIVVQ